MESVELIASILIQAVADKGHARIAFPGGKSALALMKNLRQRNLPWENISITLVDERDVPITDKASNERLVRSVMLKSKATLASFEPLRIRETADLSVAVLNQFPNILDIAVLGIGTDGHFASVFPADKAELGLSDTLRGFVATPPRGDPKVIRISMTLCEILSAGTVLLLVDSIEKQAKLIEAFAKPNNPNNPVSYLMAKRQPLYIQWANSKLSTLM